MLVPGLLAAAACVAGSDVAVVPCFYAARQAKTSVAACAVVLVLAPVAKGEIAKATLHVGLMLLYSLSDGSAVSFRSFTWVAEAVSMLVAPRVTVSCWVIAYIGFSACRVAWLGVPGFCACGFIS